MAKKMEQKRGILNKPEGGNQIVYVTKKGVISLAPHLRNIAKRPLKKSK